MDKINFFRMKDYRLKNLEEIIGLVQQENKEQIEKWGIQILSSGDWFQIIIEELGEYSRAIMEARWRNGPMADVINEGIQTVTLLMKTIDNLIEQMKGTFETLNVECEGDLKK